MTTSVELDDTNIFIVSWDMTGLDYVFSVKELKDNELFGVIKTGVQTDVMQQLNSRVSHMIMRARANSQRRYEIYSIHGSPEIYKEDIEQLFDDDPQNAADLIRERGTKLYSDASRFDSIRKIT